MYFKLKMKKLQLQLEFQCFSYRPLIPNVLEVKNCRKFMVRYKILPQIALGKYKP